MRSEATRQSLRQWQRRARTRRQAGGTRTSSPLEEGHHRQGTRCLCATPSESRLLTTPFAAASRCSQLRTHGAKTHVHTRARTYARTHAAKFMLDLRGPRLSRCDDAACFVGCTMRALLTCPHLCARYIGTVDYMWYTPLATPATVAQPGASDTAGDGTSSRWVRRIWLLVSIPCCPPHHRHPPPPAARLRPPILNARGRTTDLPLRAPLSGAARTPFWCCSLPSALALLPPGPHP